MIVAISRNTGFAICAAGVVVLTGFVVLTNHPARSAAKPPTTEARLVARIDHYRRAWNANSNGMDDSGIRARRAAAICHVMHTQTASRWTGTVEAVGLSDLPGMHRQIGAWVTIRVSRHLTFSTAEESPLDTEHTMANPGTPLFTELQALQKGERVSFTGGPFSDKHDCMQETSATEDGGMTDPDFLFRFDRITPDKG